MIVVFACPLGRVINGISEINQQTNLMDFKCKSCVKVVKSIKQSCRGSSKFQVCVKGLYFMLFVLTHLHLSEVLWGGLLFWLIIPLMHV